MNVTNYWDLGQEAILKLGYNVGYHFKCKSQNLFQWYCPLQATSIALDCVLAASNASYLQSNTKNTNIWPRPSSFEPGNWAGLVAGTNFVVCLYGRLPPGRLGWNSRNKNQNGATLSCIIHDRGGFVNSNSALLIKKLILLKRKYMYTRQTMWHFSCYVAKVRLFCQTSLSQLPKLECSY